MPGRWLSWFVILVLAAPASARPPHKQSLRRHYGELLPAKLFACSTCHLTREQADDPVSFDVDYPPHNAFGVRLSELGDQLEAAGQPSDIASRLRAVASEDTDGDGAANELEILSGHAPGIAADRPTADDLAAIAPLAQQFAARQADYLWTPFRPVERPPTPVVDRHEWLRNPIDAFVAEEHQKYGLQPRPEAPRHVLLRRVYLDLIGLPPTRKQLHQFLNDHLPDAYAKVVQELLASPQYGERWGRHWMDVWRYSDWAGWSDGKQIRDSQPHIWRWRDWIVESLNADVSYDQMLREMLAADELYPGDTAKLRATGYLVRNYKMLSRETWMQDTVMHTAQAFLGLTLGCARCHDHRYDALAQEEYYRFRAIFEPHQVRLDRLPGQPDTTQDGLARAYDADVTVATYLFERGDDRKPDKEHPLAPGVPSLLGPIEFKPEPVALPPAVYYPGLTPFVQQETVAAAEAQVAKARAALDEARAKVAPGLVLGSSGVPATEPAAIDPLIRAVDVAERSLRAAEGALASTQARIAADNARYAQPPTANANDLALTAGKVEREAAWFKADADIAVAEQHLAAAQDGLAQKPDDAAAKKAVADAEKKLADLKPKRDAAEKARAETSPNYSPITPVYAHTSSGRRAALAGWLTDRRNPLAARVAINHLWLRHFGQALVPSTFDFGQNGQPPTNPALVDWLAAELMEPSVGPPAPPWSMKHLHWLIVTSAAYRMASTPDAANVAIDPDNRRLWRMNSRRMEAELVRDGVFFVAGSLDTTQGGADIDYQLGLSVPRRSIYFRHAQEKQMEFLKTFDCAAVTECYERKQSIVPQQALALANSELTLVQSRRLARRLNEETGSDPSAFANAAFEQILSRPATAEEVEACAEFIQKQQDFFGSRSAEDVPFTSDFSKPSADPALRAREDLVHALFNHHDFVTIR